MVKANLYVVCTVSNPQAC